MNALSFLTCAYTIQLAIKSGSQKLNIEPILLSEFRSMKFGNNLDKLLLEIMSDSWEAAVQQPDKSFFKDYLLANQPTPNAAYEEKILHSLLLDLANGDDGPLSLIKVLKLVPVRVRPAWSDLHFLVTFVESLNGYQKYYEALSKKRPIHFRLLLRKENELYIDPAEFELLKCIFKELSIEEHILLLVGASKTEVHNYSCLVDLAVQEKVFKEVLKIYQQRLIVTNGVRDLDVKLRGIMDF